MTRIRRWPAAGLAALVVLGVACNPSRDGDAERAVVTIVVSASPSSEPASSGSAPDHAAPDTAAPTSASADVERTTTSGPRLEFSYADYFDVDSLGSEPVRGSGCGVESGEAQWVLTSCASR